MCERGSTYDAAGRLSSVTNPLGTFTHGWDAASNLASTTYGNGFQAGYVYDGVNRLSNVTIKRTSDPSPIALATINYDTLSRRQTVTFTADGSTIGYAFDNADRLLTLSHGFVTTSNNFTETASYDPAGKRISDTFSDPALQWTINLNPTSSIPPLTYNYDEFNQLAQVISTTSTYGQYTPDALGRLTQRVAIQQGGTDSQAYMSGDGVHDQDVADSLYQRPNGATPWTSLGSRSYVPGPDPDERLAFIDADGTIRVAHINMIGTLVALSQSGNPVLKLATGPWGESTAAVSAATGATAYPYRYTGQRQDVFANLYDYKARSYMPATGRFTQTDPSGTADNVNLYAYASDDPINGTDSTGLGCGTHGNWDDPFCSSGLFVDIESVGATRRSEQAAKTNSAGKNGFAPQNTLQGNGYATCMAFPGGSAAQCGAVSNGITAQSNAVGTVLAGVVATGVSGGAARAGLTALISTNSTSTSGFTAAETVILRNTFGQGPAEGLAVLKALENGTANIPAAATPQLLARYAAIAQAAIDAGIDRIGTQAIRLQIIKKLLGK